METKTSRARKDHIGVSNRQNLVDHQKLQEKPTSYPLNVNDRIYNTPCLNGINSNNDRSVVESSGPAPLASINRLFPVTGPKELEDSRSKQLVQRLPQSFNDVLGFQGRQESPFKERQPTKIIEKDVSRGSEIEAVFHPDPATALADKVPK